jgi:hypothetical protein
MSDNGSPLRQRQPRVLDKEYLRWLRTQPCACCRRAPPSDAAHLRASSLEHGKEMTGFGAKPDDKWSLPLNHRCHMAQHDHGNEIEWWKSRGVDDPFALAIKFYKRYKKE